MSNNYIKNLVEETKEKLNLLVEYRNITNSMIDKDFETFTMLIAERQVLIHKIDKHTLSIKEIVYTQDNDVKPILQQILKFKNVRCDDSLIEFKKTTLKIEKVLIEISGLEIKLKSHLDSMKKELDSKMLTSQKSKQIIEYCDSFARNHSSGAKLDILS